MTSFSSTTIGDHGVATAAIIGPPPRHLPSPTAPPAAIPHLRTGTAIQPWQRPWWWCAPGEIPTLGWILLIHVLAVVGVILLPLPSLTVLGVAAVLGFLGGLGTTLAYHRHLTHRAVSLNPVVEQILIFFAMLNGSGNPNTWVAMHRLHHATSDGDDDISAPKEGFWWAHLRWLWQADQSRGKRFSQDLQTWRYRFWGYVQIPVLGLSCFGCLLLWPGSDVLTACLWIGPMRLVWALHAQCTVNSICHLGAPSSQGGSSRNVWWLTAAHLFQGENWHANHHRHQTDPRLGYGLQPDMGWWAIRVLRLCGLAGKVRDPLHRRSKAIAAPATI